MDVAFTTKLSTFLSNPNLQFKYHNAPIKIETLPEMRRFADDFAPITGKLAGISSECAIWVHTASARYRDTVEYPHSVDRGGAGGTARGGAGAR